MTPASASTADAVAVPTSEPRPAAAPAPVDSPTPSRSTQRLLAAAVAGPAFVAVSLAQVPFRDGFDLRRHAFSFLLNGPGAALQAVTTALVLLAVPALSAREDGATFIYALVSPGFVATSAVLVWLRRQASTADHPR